MLNVQYKVKDLKDNSEYEGVVDSFDDSPTTCAKIIQRIETLFVTDSIAGNGAIEITFTFDFIMYEEVDHFTRVYYDRVHVETL